MSTRYFLALNGVKGDSLNSTYKGWFEVAGFDFDLANPANIGSATGGTGAGKLTFSPLTLTLDSNSGLAPLLAKAATGATLNGATLVGVNDAGQQVYHLDLANVSVTNVEHHAEAFPEAGPTLTLGYSQIELETFTPDGAGGVVPEGHVGAALPSADPGGSVAATPEGRAMDYFMLIPGLNGGSLDRQHGGWFEITGVDLDMEKLAAGDFASLNVTVPGAVDLPELFKMAMTGSDLAGHGLIRGVHIEGITRVGATPTKVYDLILADVRVSNLGASHAAGGETLDYSLSLDYGKIALVTNGIDGSGKPVKNGEFAYDVTNHTEIAPFSLGLTPGDGLSSFGGGTRYFLKLDDVDGDVDGGDVRIGGEDWFEVNSLDFDIEGTGLAGKKPTWSPLTLTLDSNSALAPLLTKAAAGQHFKDATLVGVRADGPGFSQLDLAMVFVTKVEEVTGGGLTVNLDFGALKIQQLTQDQFGGVHPPSDFQWDKVLNQPEYPNELTNPGGGPSTPIDPPSSITVAGVSIVDMPSSPEPATYFMLIDGLNGGSTDASHRGWFEITGLDFDLANPTSIGPATGGGGAGKPDFSLLNVTLPDEAALADVMALVATGTLVKGVRIEGVTGGPAPAKVYELSLGNVVATKVADGEDGGYSLSLDYGNIALVTTNEAGAQAQTHKFTYDVVTNTDDTDPSSLALSPASSGGGHVAPAKYFLALDGVKGDSLDSTHKGWFEISGFDFDLANTFSIGSATGGAGAGKLILSPLTLTLDSNTGLAPLLTMAATGATLNGATLVGVNAAGQQVYQIDLAHVSVTNVEHHADPSTDAAPALTLRYGQIELETFTRNGTGGVAPEGQFGFDQTANTGGVTVPSTVPGGSVAASPQPATYFMLIDGINGGSTDPSHKGWFEITGFDLDLAHATTPGGGTGTADFSPLNVTLPHETRLADVMALLATGELVTGVRIEGVTGGATPAKVYDLTLADVAVTKVADGEDDGYSLSLDYGRIALVTKGIDAAGQQITNGEFGYDAVNNTEIDPFTLALNPGHDPVANAQSIGTDEDTATAVTLSGSDADGDSLLFTVTSGPAHGTLSGTGANLTYTPAANYNGPDSFSYVANDGWTDSAAASVSLTVKAVNDAPVANAQSISTDEDTAKAVTLSGSDVEGNGLTYRVVSGPAHGTLSGSGANLTYTPVANYNGPDSFTYVANDGAADSAAASISLTVQAVNDAPAFTSPAIFAVAENNTTIGTVTATDIEGNPLTFAIAGGADQALFAIDPGGALRLIAAPDFETPQDANRDNVYDLVVSATDSLGGVSTQTLAVGVANLAERGDNGETVNGTAGNDILPGLGGPDTILGFAGNDALDGGAGDDSLDGGTGNDVMRGGLGDDSYVVDSSLDIVIEKAGEGTDTVNASIHFALTADVENLVLQGDATTPLQGYGNALANHLTGSAGANLLNGLGGADTMAGGLGNDVYFADDALDFVVENSGEGNDAVFSTVDYTLAANVETLVLQGVAGLKGTGNNLDNAIYGNSGNNTLDGGTGADALFGGAGDDTYFVDVGDWVAENPGEGRDTIFASIHYALPTNVENLVLQGDATTPLQGYGNELVNVLTGSDGGNLLNGRGGADVMAGGLGNDVYFVDDSGDQVIENPGEGTDAIFSMVSRVLDANVETLALQGTGNLSGDGNTLANKLYGNAGDNALNGQDGADMLNGGFGHDSLTGGAGSDTFVFVAGQADGDVVVDFAGLSADGDTLKFVGYGAGASFTQNDATHWQVDGGGLHEVIRFQNGASIDPSDVVFV
jgi:type VI protein secretion system component Hcp